MVNPRGGRLVNRVLKGKSEIISNLDKFQHLEVSLELAFDLENIAKGVYSPLEGFLNKEDYKSVLYKKRLANGIPWTFPIVLSLNKEEAKKISKKDKVIVFYKRSPIALLSVTQIYRYEKREFEKNIFGTDSLKHPGVKKLQNQGEYLIGGKIDLINSVNSKFKDLCLYPKETRVLFKEKGWQDVVGFQTRNVPHLGHEYVQKTALSFCDGLFINPLIGRKKVGDFRDEVIIASYKVLIDKYYLKKNAVLAVLQTEMRYAGPREAVHHAIMRKNFGCTHFIVGRGHAGVGSFYPPYAAHRIFDEFPDLGITPLFFKSFFWCKRCSQVVNEKICPHNEKFHIHFSGTKIRKMLSEGKVPPGQMMRPEVAEAIRGSKDIFVKDET